MVKREAKKDDRKLFAFLAVFLTIIGFIIALVVKRNDKYVMFYAKQGLILFFASIIAWIIAWIVGMFFVFIPVLGTIVYWVLYLAVLALWIIGMVNSLSGEEKKLPYIGDFADKINL